jgi:hypothetical protein
MCASQTLHLIDPGRDVSAEIFFESEAFAIGTKTWPGFDFRGCGSKPGFINSIEGPAVIERVECGPAAARPDDSEVMK